MQRRTNSYIYIYIYRYQFHASIHPSIHAVHAAQAIPHAAGGWSLPSLWGRDPSSPVHHGAAHVTLVATVGLVMVTHIFSCSNMVLNITRTHARTCMYVCIYIYQNTRKIRENMDDIVTSFTFVMWQLGTRLQWNWSAWSVFFGDCIRMNTVYIDVGLMRKNNRLPMVEGFSQLQCSRIPRIGWK